MSKSFENPYFAEYVRLLLRLHKLMSSGKSDTDEADAVRDEMDFPWHQLSDEEIALVRGLSADLYTVGATRPLPNRTAEEMNEQLRWVETTDDYIEILDFLREHEEGFPPAEVAYLRGFCWSRLGQEDVAVEFFWEALRLNPDDSIVYCSLLHCLLRAHRLAEASILALKTRLDSADGPRLLLTALALFEASVNERRLEGVELRQRAIESAKRGVQLVKPDHPDVWVRTLRVEVQIWLALSLVESGDTTQALQACASVLALDPNHRDALHVRAWLTKQDQPVESFRDLQRGMRSFVPDLKVNLTASSVCAN